MCGIKVRYKLYILNIVCLCLLPKVGLSEESDPTPFAKSYLNLEATWNFPIGKSRERFTHGEIRPLLGYRHKIDDSWLMGVGGQFKSLTKDSVIEGSNNTLAILSFYHESLFIMRLYHPTYLLAGPKILYLVPSQASRLPLVRDSEEDVEVGAGLSSSLIHFMSERALISLRLDIWRGTKTTHLSGVEGAFGVSWTL